MVLECDVNVYSEALFRKVWAALNPEGRFVIVDQLAPERGVAPPSRLHWACPRRCLHAQQTACGDGGLDDDVSELPDGRQADPRPALRGLSLVLQRAVSAQAQFLRGPRSRRKQGGRVQGCSPAGPGSDAPVHGRALHRRVAGEGFPQRHRKRRGRRLQQLADAAPAGCKTTAAPEAAASIAPRRTI